MLTTSMQLTIVQISDEPTSNGNLIVKLQHKEVVNLGFATKDKSVTYYTAVQADALTGKVGDSVDLDMGMFEIVERPYNHPEHGEIMLKWLHLK